MPMNLLIDGDIVAYRCAAAAQDVTYKAVVDPDEDGEGRILGTCKAGENTIKDFRKWAKEERAEVIKEVEPGEPSHAIHLAKTMLEDIVARVGETRPEHTTIRLCTSAGGPTFRHKYDHITVYKGNRKPEDVPVHVKTIRNWMENSWGVWKKEGYEADDLMGIGGGPGDIIATIDKDLDMIPGTRFNFTTNEYIFKSEEEALCNFYRQLLTGDRTDNIPGIPGRGEAFAAKYIVSFMSPEEMWDETCLAYWEAYNHQRWGEDNHRAWNDLQFGWKDVLFEMAQLIWILRDWNHWEPPFPYPEFD